MSKKRKYIKVSSNLLINIYNEVSNLGKNFQEFKEEVKDKFNTYNGLAKDVNTLKEFHNKVCNIQEINKTINKAIGIFTILGIIAPILISAIFNIYTSDFLKSKYYKENTEKNIIKKDVYKKEKYK